MGFTLAKVSVITLRMAVFLLTGFQTLNKG